VKRLVLKLGGELLEGAEDRLKIARFARTIGRDRALVVVHGGGRAIDAELTRRHIAPRKVDGLRVTDAATLDAVVAVLAGSANTELVAAFVGAGVKAVGLTGVDAGFGRATRVAAHVTAEGQAVDLGLVGDPAAVDAALIETLLAGGYVPVIASLGLEDDRASGQPRVLNVNADVMAGRIAAALGGSDLVIAGATPGVLDADGRSIAELDVEGVTALVASGTVTAGMIAKLAACRSALDAGVTMVRIVDGRALDGGRAVETAPGTTLVSAARTTRA
jgi:acetylglutamate kinase